MLDILTQELQSTPKSSFHTLPEKPGVYILKNTREKPAYVGKATSIRARVFAHMRPRFDDPVGLALKEQISSVDYIFTQSPLEALILENVLIKRHKPRYNIRLKDDKSYPFVKISNEQVPRVLVTRKLDDDGSDYFGPYANARAARMSVKYLRKIFPIRGCSLPLDWSKKFRSCIDYSIGLCKAPCIFAVSKGEYDQDVRKFKLFLDGKLVQLSKVMYEDMWRASDNQDYESASKIRNNIRSLEATALRQRIAFPGQIRDKDIVTIAREGNIAASIVFEVRGGNVIDRKKFLLDGVDQNCKDEEIISAFVKQHYSQFGIRGRSLHEIVVPVELPEMDMVQQFISNSSNQVTSLVLSSASEENKKLMRLAQENAVMALKEQESRDEVRKRERLRALKDLKEIIEMGKLPKRIECFDISNLQGNEAVGAMTVFVDGFPEKSQYRKFRIKTVKGIDDYSMMAEMISRRFNRLYDTNWAKAQPDLVVIDGGKGHLKAAVDQMHKDGVFGVPTIALAKKEELVFRQDRRNPLKLSRDSEALHILQQIRDEAHRFGITFHRKLRAKKMTTSVLDNIAGVGEKRKRNLIAHFGSVAAIKRSSVEEISQVPMMSDKLAYIILKSLDS